MSLLDVQRSLVGFARGSTSAYQHCDNLTQAEREWLTQLLHSPGLLVTQQIQQWWRISRVCSAAPLTIELLKRDQLEDLIIEYVTTEPVRTLFFAAELEQFKLFIQQHPRTTATIKTLVEFEYEIKNAYQTSVASARGKAHITLAKILHFKHDPIRLLSALLTGTTLPIETQDYYILVSPALPEHWRMLTDAECAQYPELAEIYI